MKGLLDLKPGRTELTLETPNSEIKIGVKVDAFGLIEELESDLPDNSFEEKEFFGMATSFTEKHNRLVRENLSKSPF